jgi:sugar O-acyltransferase (sialic acid O-acetyltransferase NeuD family)
MELVRVPLLNANEDEVEVVAVQVEEGTLVRSGDVLCVVESTKATVDVEAPVSGYVRKLDVRRGMRAKVGQVICAITETASEQIELPAETRIPGAGPVRATKKARELAERHGIDLSNIRTEGLITERDVEAAIGTKPVAPTLRADSRPAGDRVVVYGASGHAKVVIDILRESYKDLRVEAIVDDSVNEKELFDIRIIGTSSELARLHKEGIGNAVLGIGSVSNHRARRALYEKLVTVGFHMPNVIHSRAAIEPSVTMGAGNQIFAGAIVGSAAELGDNTIINSGVVVSHDCRIGSHTHVSPGAILAGGVTIGEGTLIGMGVTVFLGVRIGANVLISNGVNIFSDVPDNAVVRSSQPRHS